MTKSDETKGLLQEDSDASDEVNRGEHSGVTTYEDAIKATGYGPYHILVLVLCGWAVSSDAVEVLSVSFLLPTAACDLRMDSTEKGILSSVIFLGMMFGGYFWGSLADTFGRKSILIWSLAVNGVFGLFSSFSQTYWLFCIFRFFSGIGVGGSIPVIFSYFTEFQPKDKRGMMISLLAMFWMCGNLVAASLAWIIIPHPDLGYFSENYIYNSWRIFVAFCTVPSLSSAIMFRFMPESPKFLLQHGRESEALEVLKKIHRINHYFREPSLYQVSGLNLDKTEDHPSESLSVSINKAEIASTKTSKKSTARGIIELFASTRLLFKRPYLKSTLVLIIINNTLAFGYYGLWLWFPEIFSRIEKYGGSACDRLNFTANATVANFTNCRATTDNWIFLSGFLTALSNLPGIIVTVFLMDKVGRKPLLASSMVISGLSVFFIWFVSNKYQNLAIACLFGAVSTIGWNALDVLSVEIYPTNMRSTGMGFQTGLARIAAILGNLAFGLLVDVHCAIPMFLVAGFLILGGLSAILLPNTIKTDIH